MESMKLLESGVVEVRIPMTVIARHGDWVMARYFSDDLAEVYIYNTRTKALYSGYFDIEEVYEDWQELTGQYVEEL